MGKCPGAQAPGHFPQRFTPGARASQDDGRPAWRSSWPCALFDWERHANRRGAAYRYRGAAARAAQRFARQDWYDVWFPTLSPSAALVKQAHEAKTAADWNAFFRHYKAEMKSPDAAHALDLLAAMSQHSDLSVGCYCEMRRTATARRFASCWWRRGDAGRRMMARRSRSTPCVDAASVPTNGRHHLYQLQALPSICSCAANIVTCGIWPAAACFFASSR